MADTVLIQPVESPVICKPYYEPTHYWEYSKETGKAEKVEGRRIAAYWYKIKEAGDSSQMMIELEEDRRDLELVNKLRTDVKRWRESNWEGATNVTKDLLRHWWRKDRVRRFFFCQLEAVETVIFLNEIRGFRSDGSRGNPRWKPSFTDTDFDKLIDTPLNPEYNSIIRMACKMATGSGKTVVMAMIIAWSFCNRARVQSDIRFPQAALICCPNLTIKERLQVLKPDSMGQDYYSQFDIIPPQYRDLIRSGKVLITNWHFFAPESEQTEGGSTYRVVNKGIETAEAFAKKRLGDMYEMGPILVFNDEAHHAYRPKFNDEELAAVLANSSQDIYEATVWVQGLDKINKACGIRACIDLSATPFYLKGSGYPEGEPFPWIISDFGLVDAIESGITKIPRLPVSDTTGKPDPVYFRLWKNITSDLAASQRLSNKRPKPEVVWERAQSAFVQLAGEYKKTYDAIQESNDLASKIPPVMILVCDNTDIAKVFYEKISGESEVEVIDQNSEQEGKSDQQKHKLKKITSYGMSSSAFPELFQNSERNKVTIRIDSKILEKAESEDPDVSRDVAAKALREMVNTVGKTGQPGQNVHCVVSVAMLNEGWDANNVTHILGVRAFGSQLLCEQVVGRGLRRINYFPDPETELLPEEYVDVYGIPFSVIPYKGKKSTTPPDKPVNRVHALPDREAMEIKFPNVEGYVFALNQPSIKIDFDGLETLSVLPEYAPEATFVRIVTDHVEGGILGGGIGEFIIHDRSEYYKNHHIQEIEFEIARQIVTALVGEGPNAPVQGTPKMRGYARHILFPQVFKIVKRYVDEKVDFQNVNKCELGLDRYTKIMRERLINAIEPDETSGELPLLPILNRFKPIGTTRDVDFTTKRSVHHTVRSHVNAVVLDSAWEQSTSFYLEADSQNVECYVRNDKPFLLIPYEYDGVQHYFEPDFIVKLTNGTSLILEVKGWEDDQDKAKYQAAKRWVSAVNNWGRLGVWGFYVMKQMSSGQIGQLSFL